jgi:hypothetical protein
MFGFKWLNQLNAVFGGLLLGDLITKDEIGDVHMLGESWRKTSLGRNKMAANQDQSTQHSPSSSMGYKKSASLTSQDFHRWYNFG